jgi:hypothetical protein
LGLVVCNEDEIGPYLKLYWFLNSLRKQLKPKVLKIQKITLKIELEVP